VAQAHSHFATQTNKTCLKSATTNKFNFAVVPCVLLPMVSTQPTNKDAHPGLLDQPNVQQKQLKPKDANATLKQQHAIQDITTIEKDLLTKQQNSSTNAHKPPGPGGTKE